MAKEERIRTIAYSIWEEESRPDGRAEEHWLRALELVSVEVESAPALPGDRSAPDWLRREPATGAETPLQSQTGETRDKSAKRPAETKAA